MKKEFKILELVDLSIGYKSKGETNTLVKNINISANKGKLIALMGLNGAGKTTLFKTILQEIKPISGEIKIKNESLKNNQISHLISVVFTERIKLFGFTVFDLIAMGRMPHTNHFGKLKAEDKNIVNQYIKLLELESIKIKQINTLSDGQFQKVMIAKALTQETPLILLDEPTAFLDIKNKEMIYNLLQKIVKNEGKTVIVSTHNLEFCKEFCNELWLVKKKEIIASNAKEVTKEMF